LPGGRVGLREPAPVAPPSRPVSRLGSTACGETVTSAKSEARWRSGCFLTRELFRSLCMQPLAISSFASTIPRPASLTPRDAPTNSPGAQDAPVFAHMVGDAVNGSTTWQRGVSEERLSAPRKIIASAKERNLDALSSLGKNVLQAALTPASAVSPASLPALSATSLSLAPLARLAVEQSRSVAPKVDSGIEPSLRSSSATPGPSVGGASLTKTGDDESLAQVLGVKVAEQLRAQSSVATTPTMASSLSSGPVVGAMPAGSAPASDAAKGPLP
jgi:hypothetical protein